MRPAFYNETDPYCADWLRNLIDAGLIPPGDVDERDVRQVAADDLRGYGQIHLFAGIGGFGYAARLAGLPDDFPVLTGGFPCQPFSCAGERRGISDDRHLWPEMHRLVAALRPRWVLGENVSGLVGMALDGVLFDLEGEGYTCWPALVPACAVDAPHRRDRLWIVGHTERARADVHAAAGGSRRAVGESGVRGDAVADGERAERWPQPEGRDVDHRTDRGRSEAASRAGERRQDDAVADPDQSRAREERQQRSGQQRRAGSDPRARDVEHAAQQRRREGRAEPSVRSGRPAAAEPSGVDVGHPGHAGLSQLEQQRQPGDAQRGQCSWSAATQSGGARWLAGADGKARRIPKPGFRGVADGLSDGVDGRGAETEAAATVPLLVQRHQYDYSAGAHIARLKALGNAIVPQVAAEIMRAMLGAEEAA